MSVSVRFNSTKKESRIKTTSLLPPHNTNIFPSNNHSFIHSLLLLFLFNSPSPSSPSPRLRPPYPHPPAHHRTHSRSACAHQSHSLPFTPFSSFPTLLPRFRPALLLLSDPLLRIIHARHLLDLHRRAALDLPQVLAHLLTASLPSSAPTKSYPDTPASSCSPASATDPSAACTSARTTQ